MKIVIVALSVSCICIAQRVCAQKEGALPGRINIILEHGKLRKFFALIEKQGDYSFNIPGSLYDIARPVNVRLVNATIEQALAEGLKGQPLQYSIRDHGVIIITLKDSAAKPVWDTIRAYIRNEAGKPVEGAMVSVKGTAQKTYSDSLGRFELRHVNYTAVLTITGGDIYSAEYKPAGREDSVIMVYAKKDELGSITVTTMNNGLDYIPVALQPGSYTTISGPDLERNLSASVFGRFRLRVSGVLDNSNSLLGITPFTNIRGLNSIDGNMEPMIIIDNMVQHADMMQIPLNPNDIESITVLKDAAAAMWGIRGGNGVIVITTKSGSRKKKPHIQIFQALGWQRKPDLRYTPFIGIDNYIDIEEYLFKHGFYDDRINNPGKLALTPVQEILLQERSGIILPDEARARIDEQRKKDAISDLDKYFYQTAVTRQFYLSLDGGGKKYSYYIGAGMDANDGSLKGSGYRRTSMRMNLVSTPARGLALRVGVGFIQEKEINQLSHPKVGYPYADLVDDAGNPLTVISDLRQGYKDTVVKGSLLDWNYRPYDDLRNNNKTVMRTSLHLNPDIKYNISNQLSVGLSYQYNLQRYEANDFQNLNMYATRHAINRFMQLQSGAYVPVVPVGAMADLNNILSISHNVRSSIAFNKVWAGTKTAFISTAGVEYRSLHTGGDLNTVYGVTADHPQGTLLNYEERYPLFNSPNGTGFIYGNHSSAHLMDHFVSYFVNAAFTHQNKYIVNAGVRYEKARIASVDTSYRDAPFVSGGMMWDVSREGFFTTSFIRSLRVRFTTGTNGNNDKSFSAYTVNGNTSLNLYRVASNDLPLRWERVLMTNLGLDLVTKNDRVRLIIDYYRKRASELFGSASSDPSVPANPLTSNVAKMKGYGLDITLNTHYRIRRVNLKSDLVLSHAVNKVVDYQKQEKKLWQLLESKVPFPVTGRPLFSIYALKWAGLDPQTGDPRGYYNGVISKDYAAILNVADPAVGLVYKGPAQPTWFGTLLQEISWKKISVSLAFSLKMGHYFRRPVMTYQDFYNNNSLGHEEFDRRWQKPGDETWTNVPSMLYISSTLNNRDRVYRYSEAAIEKADHIRWQDVCVSYQLNRKDLPWLPCNAVQLYAVMNNLGIVWKATDQHEDPDFLSGYPNPRSLTIGVKFDFDGAKK